MLLNITMPPLALVLHGSRLSRDGEINYNNTLLWNESFDNILGRVELMLNNIVHPVSNF